MRDDNVRGDEEEDILFWTTTRDYSFVLGEDDDDGDVGGGSTHNTAHSRGESFASVGEGGGWTDLLEVEVGLSGGD